MVAIDELVPDFHDALARVPANAATWQVLCDAVRHCGINARAAALIHVAVAQSVGCDYGRWVMQRLAARQWLNAEDTFLASIGIARGMDVEIPVRAAARLARADRRTLPAVRADVARTLGVKLGSEILSHVSLATLACEVLRSIAPGKCDVPARTRNERG